MMHCNLPQRSKFVGQKSSLEGGDGHRNPTAKCQHSIADSSCLLYRLSTAASERLILHLLKERLPNGQFQA
jgi:hypothetical protein